MLSPDEKRTHPNITQCSVVVVASHCRNLEQSRTEITCADGGFLNDNGGQYAKPMCGLNLKESAVASVLVVIVAWYRKDGGVRCLVQRDGWIEAAW